MSKSENESMNEGAIEQMMSALTPEIVESFRRAIEISKWPDGRRITAAQRATCMQAIIAWEHRYLPENQRIGYIDKGDKQEGEVCESSHDDGHDHDHDHEKPISFRH